MTHRSGALAGLTDREREVMILVGQGLSNDEIAAEWVVSPATVRTHVSRAMMKLHARDRAQLVVMAYQHGLGTRVAELRPLPRGGRLDGEAPDRHRGGMRNHQPAVRVDRLTKRYGDRSAVDELTFELPRGVVAGFIGPNGAGKTTTMAMLLGLVAPTTGTGLDARPPARPPRSTSCRTSER